MAHFSLYRCFRTALFSLVLAAFPAIAATPTFTISGITDESLIENNPYSSAPPVTAGIVAGNIHYSLLSSVNPFTSNLAIFEGKTILEIVLILMADDSDLFSVDSSTGVVSMVQRDFEAPADSDADNDYFVTLVATDDAGNANSISWHVDILDQPPVVFSLSGISDKSLFENSDFTFSAPNLNGSSIGAITYSLSGADSNFFTVNSTTGVVTFNKQDFEHPLDANHLNTYEVTLTGRDSDNNTASISWVVTILNLPPLIFSIAPIAETHPEFEAYTSPAPAVSGSFRGPLTYELSGGDDIILFTVSAGGIVSLGAQNYLFPIDFNQDNVYEVEITATDSDGNTSSSTVAVTITDIPIVPTNDADGDGVPDTVERAENTMPNNAGSFKDTDGDGAPDYVDIDADNDGLINVDDNQGHEPYTDHDTDGTPDYLDADDRGDGNNATCTDLNADRACENGYPLDPWFDSEQDGRPNHADYDSDGDFLPDAVETDTDSDSDGDTDYLDIDSDDDGIPDIIESGTNGADNNFNGIPDYFDAGITGGLDADHDGIDDNISAFNSDTDGLPNYLDLDSDNDGIPDTLEGTRSSDADTDDIDDLFDVDITFGFDINNDGIDDLWRLPDTDGDILPDYIDIDSDNDGISDAIEAGSSALDIDTDGIDDQFDSDFNAGTDSNADGILENAIPDSDADNALDHHDLDSDNDSIPDTTESGTADVNQDALKDTDTLASLPLPDIDNDLTPDYLDTDSNADTIFDITGTAYAAFDLDNDGRVDLTSDPDRDGIDNAIDTAPSQFGLLTVVPPLDTDGDGEPDTTDPDIDGDNISNISEGNIDTDSDGITNPFDRDSDNDGISDLLESGTPLQTGDANANGIDDSVDVLVTGGTDGNADGIADLYLPRDSDQDGIRDYLDADSDNDSYGDRLETSGFTLSGVDTDNDGIDDAFDAGFTGGFDANNDGIADDLFPLLDTDNDTVKNHLDSDSDNDNIGDATEGLANSDADTILNRFDRDSDGDGISDLLESGTPARIGDTNLNGLDDSIDVLLTGGVDGNHDGLDDAYPPADSDNDGLVDYLDADSDNDGLGDLEETSGLILSGSDSDLDGIDNTFDVDVTLGTDANNDGIDDIVVTLLDTDNDGKFNHLDKDSDNDGFLDGVENDDTNHDGIPDRLQPEGKVKASSGSGSNSLLLMMILGLAFLGRACLIRRPVWLIATLALQALPLQAEEEIVCRDYTAWPSNNAAFQPCFYVGMGLGLSTLDPDTSDSSWDTIDNKDAGFTLYGGYHFSHSWFAELMYANLGKATMDNKHILVTAQESIDYSAVSAFGGYYLPLDELFRAKMPVKLFLKAGVAQLSNKASDSLVRLDADSQTLLAGGMGIEWPFAKDWMLRGEIDTFSAEAKLLNISVAYWFGGKKHYYEVSRPKPVEEPMPETAPAETVAAATATLPETRPVPELQVTVAYGEGTKDSDDDGIVDILDDCPKTPANARIDKKGCASYKGYVQSLYGAFNSTDLTYPSYGLLDTVIGLLKSFPDTRIEIQAHTDDRGSTELNQKLSEQRAEVVKQYLVDHGIDASRIETQGFGELKPLATNETEQGRSKNRRIDFKVLDQGL